MVTDTEGDTGFVMPIRVAEKLSNLRFQFLPEFFADWTELKGQRDALQERVNNLERQAEEAKGIADRRKQEVDALNQRLDETSRALKRKTFATKFYRVTTVIFGVAAATLFITR